MSSWVSWVAWRKAAASSLIDQLPDVDLVVGTQKFHRTADYLDDIFAGRREKIVETGAEQGSEAAIKEHILNGSKAHPPRVTAFVSIMQGCNQYCTFCIVPYTRGEERSRSMADIVAECRELVRGGVKEITLLGQIVTSYGKREIPLRNGQSGFVQLLEAVHEIDGLERIRFTSPHPKGYGDDLVAAYGRLPKLCQSAHLPVQSGSDRILRPCTAATHARAILDSSSNFVMCNRTSASPPTSLSVFPAKRRRISRTRSRWRGKSQFDNAYLFKYSPRKDTPAANMPDQLPDEIKEQRHARVLEEINAIGRRRYEQQAGRTAQILVEGPSRNNPARLMGRTRCNKIVLFEGSPRHRGQLLDLKITRAGSFTLYGDPAIVNLD